MKNYSKEVLDGLINYNVIIIFKDNNVALGTLLKGYTRSYYLKPLTINDGGIMFNRNTIKKIILFNGFVCPKEKSFKRYKELNIMELNDLVNKAGYEFI